MNCNLVFLTTVLVLCASSILATRVNKCRGTDLKIDNIAQTVNISECDNPPCILKRQTTIYFLMRIKPENDVQRLHNHVFANVLNLPLPFIGVDGTDACPTIYSADGETQVGCPLKGGQEYVYKRQIDVLQIYPTIKVNVHWGLVDSDTSKNIHCFEVPARIV